MQRKMHPGSNWSDPAYLFDFYTETFGGHEYLSYPSYEQALRIAKRIVALGAFDSVEEVVAAADERFNECF